MRLHEFVHLAARRLGLKVGRVQAIAGRLQDEGSLQKTEGSRRFPLEISEPEMVTLLLALLGESGIGSGPEAARTFGALQADDGTLFERFLSHVLFGPPVALRHVIVRQNPPGISVVVNGAHVQFGAPSSTSNASPARIAPGEALAAIAAELRGCTPQEADAEVALGQLRKALA